MEIIPLLSTIIFVATLVTIIIAIVSYSAYKIRERRRPRKLTTFIEGGEEEFQFFIRYNPSSKEKEGMVEREDRNGEGHHT